MTVISFAALKSIKQLKTHRTDLVAVLDNVRQTIGRLFEAGLVFHPEGSRTTRDLLLAQEHLGDALDALDGLPEDTDERDEQAKNIHLLLGEVGVLATRAMDRLKKLTPQG